MSGGPNKVVQRDSRVDDSFADSLFGPDKVAQLNRHCLHELGLPLHVGRDEGGALVGILGGNIPRDRSTLIEDEAIIVLLIPLRKSIKQGGSKGTHEDGDLSKGMARIFELGCLVFSFVEVDGDELERHLLLVQDGGHSSCASREGASVELENHG